MTGGQPGPVFFMSHSRFRDPDGPAVEQSRPAPHLRLFRDLWYHVGELIGPPIGVDPGFVDDKMRGGSPWDESLVAAVGNCRVFVPLLSQSYTGSRWCAKEWHAFAARDPRGDAVLPVLWLPIDEAELPPVIRRIQLFNVSEMVDSNIARRYCSEGLYGLLSMGSEDYDIVAWRLAQRIAELSRAHRIPAKTIFDHERLPSSFESGES